MNFFVPGYNDIQMIYFRHASCIFRTVRLPKMPFKIRGSKYFNAFSIFTQYSALYNSTEKTLTVCVMQDYANEYVFSFEK